jgi:hypothetical protein
MDIEMEKENGNQPKKMEIFIEVNISRTKNRDQAHIFGVMGLYSKEFSISIKSINLLIIGTDKGK